MAIFYNLSKEAWWIPWANTKFTFGESHVIFFSPNVQLEHCSMSLQETTTSTSALYYQWFACSFDHLTRSEGLGRCRSRCGKLRTPTQRLHTAAERCVLCQQTRNEHPEGLWLIHPCNSSWTDTLIPTMPELNTERWLTKSIINTIAVRRMLSRIFG